MNTDPASSTACLRTPDEVSEGGCWTFCTQSTPFLVVGLALATAVFSLLPFVSLHLDRTSHLIFCPRSRGSRSQDTEKECRTTTFLPSVCPCVRVSVCLCVSVSLCLCVCVSVSLSLPDEPSHESRKEGTSNKNKHCARSALPAAEKAHQVVLQLWTPARKCVSASADSSILANWVLQQSEGCTAHLPPQSSPSLGPTWCLRRPVFHTSQGQANEQPHRIVSFYPSLPQLQQRPLVSTHFGGNVLHAGTAH